MNPFDLKAGAARPPRAARGDRPLFHRALYRRGAFDLIAVWKKDRTLAFAAYYNVVAAAVAALPAVATGLLAGNSS